MAGVLLLTVRIPAKFASHRTSKTLEKRFLGAGWHRMAEQQQQDGAWLFYPPPLMQCPGSSRCAHAQDKSKVPNSRIEGE